MKIITTTCVFASFALTACATNPGNIGAGMYEDMLTQRAALAGGSSAIGAATGEAAVVQVADVRSCEEINADITAIYSDMQPEDAGIVRRALSTGQGIGETVALQKVAAHVPGAGMVNNLFKMKSGKKKAEAMFRSQLTTPTSQLADLQKERTIANCEGSMLDLFEEK